MQRFIWCPILCGGVTKDSVPLDEWMETEHKISALKNSFRSMTTDKAIAQWTIDALVEQGQVHHLRARI